ncbi:thioredoxin-dependent thiol peroxidase [Paenibacillus senegalensis]|uniref:thioredoxin-dependent thiol peroxidase n=1 Tax=Paenibacillus senegalensis TaxID=1465766 RepID=UPI000287BE5C|nr:thioredoxin-dependent thiol peroxidase [Paenibacillus senegalensis]
MTTLQIGKPVPDFTLPGSNGRDVSLKDFRGKLVILYFYPKNMTPTCTQQACDFRDYSAKIREAGAEIIGISPDPVTSHETFIAKHSLPFLLLADEDKEVCSLYGVWKMKKMYGREYMGVERSTFLIDQNGKLLEEWRKVRIKGHLDKILEKIQQIKT